MDLTNSEVGVESLSVLKRQVVQKDDVFKTGRYTGRSFKEVLGFDPDYIIYAYENHHDNGGLSREIYRLAQLALEEEHNYEEPINLSEDLNYEIDGVAERDENWQEFLENGNN